MNRAAPQAGIATTPTNPTTHTNRRRLFTAWCRGCNRALPRVIRGFCSHCHRTFNRSDQATVLREPRVEPKPNHLRAAATFALASLAYLTFGLANRWIDFALWESENVWPIGWLLLIALRTVVVTFLILCSLRHTGLDRLHTLYALGIFLGAILAAPYGPVAIFAGMVLGVPAALYARALSLGSPAPARTHL